MTRGTQVSVTPGVLNPGPGGHKILGFEDPGGGGGGHSILGFSGPPGVMIEEHDYIIELSNNKSSGLNVLIIQGLCRLNACLNSLAHSP